MPELLFYPSRRGTVVGVVFFAAVGIWAGLILVRHRGLHHIGASDWKLMLVAPVALIALANRWRQTADGNPRLRLSDDGIEGRFGLVRWGDVMTVDTPMRWGLYTTGRRLVINLRPGARISEPTREFAGGVGVALDRVYEDRVELGSGGFDEKLRTVEHEIERRLLAGGSNGRRQRQ